MSHPPQRSNTNPRAGFALMATLAVLTLLSVVSIAVFGSTMAAFKVGSTDVEKTRTYYAAEGASDYALSRIALALADGALADEELQAVNAPNIDGFTVDSFSVVKNGTPTIERITDGSFAGLAALTQLLDITAEASGPDGTSSEILLTAKAQSIPIFQFGVFFEKDLEIHPAGGMNFDGWVHTNGNLYINSKDIYFHDVLTTPNDFVWDRKDKHEVYNGVRIDDAGGNPVIVNFDSRDTPDPNAFRTKSDAAFDNRLMTSAYGVDSLKIPLPDGVEPTEVLKPRQYDDPQIERDSKMAWKADWYIEMDLSLVKEFRNWKDPGVRACDLGVMTHTRPAGMGVPIQEDCETIFVFQEDAWYESREGRWVDVLNIDAGALFDWVAAGGDAVETLYVHMNSDAGFLDTKGDGVFPIVRIVNGSQLDAPITFATDHPMYVQGDYNTVGWYPSAVMGDAITFLSNSWNDGQHQVAALTDTASVRSSNTTAYVAVLAGHTPSAWDHEVVGSRARYGGGLENYMRWLENWRGTRFTFRGSLVSLAFSEQAASDWIGGNRVYIAPYRDFEFDMRLDLIENMPPGTPHVGNVVHTAFRPVMN